MPKILSVDSKHEKPSRGNLLRIIREWILSLDKFTKLYLITIVLLTVVTPTIISGYLILTQQAAETSNTIASSVSQAPDNKKPISPKSFTPNIVTTATAENYAVDNEEIRNHLNLLNIYRTANGVPALKPSRALTNVAKWMVNDMVFNNYFSHTDSLGRDPFQRMTAFGYTFNTWKGENLAAGYQTGSDVLEGWKTSPGHNDNMLGPNYTAVGIYRAYSPNSDYGWYWAQEFGGVNDAEVTYIVGRVDSDNDGYTDTTELYVDTNPNKACITSNADIDTTKPTKPSKTWPADLNTNGISYNKIDIHDLGSYTAPVRHMGTSSGNPNFDVRWDVFPGNAPGGYFINVADLQSVGLGTAPMFGGQRMYGGPTCIQN